MENKEINNYTLVYNSNIDFDFIADQVLLSADGQLYGFYLNDKLVFSAPSSYIWYIKVKKNER